MKTIATWFVRQWRQVRRHAGHELMRGVADRNILLVLVVAPAVYILIFGLTYLNGKLYNIPVAVVDYDRSELSRTVIRSLRSNESLSVNALLTDESQLRDVLTREQCWGAVVIPPGMERCVKRGEQVHVVMMVNTSNIIIGNYAQKGMQAVLGSIGGAAAMERMMKTGTPSAAVRTSYLPVDLETRVLFNPTSNYALFVVPLLFMLLIHQVTALGTGMSWAKSISEEGLAKHIDGSELHVLILGRMLPYVCAALFWFFVIVAGAHTLFAIPYTGGIGTTMVFALLAAFTVVLTGSLAGLLVKDKLGVIQIIFFTSMPLLLLSGGSWPLDSMPEPVRWIAETLPPTHMMLGYRELALERPGFLTVMPHIAALAAASAVLYLLVIAALRRALRTAV